MTESCENCRLRLKLSKWDYSDVKNKGVPKEDMEGYVCLAFQNEGLAVWLVGESEKNGMCECWEERESKESIMARVKESGKQQTKASRQT